MTIHEGSGSNPGEKLFDLTGDVQLVGTSTWNAPANAVLAGDTSYFLVVSRSTQSGHDFGLSSTEADGQSGLDDWSIADSGRQEGIGSWSHWNNSLVIRLTGHERENTAPVFSAATTTRMVLENSVAGIDVGAPVTATDDDADTLTYTLAGTDAALRSPSIRSTGQIETGSQGEPTTTST